MKYYKVKKQFDGYRIHRNFSELVADELYTEKELTKYIVPLEAVEPVEVRKNDIYYFFGARFAA